MFARSTICFALGLIFLVHAASAQQVRFDGDRVVRVEVKTNDQLQTLLTMTDDVWSERIGVGALDVRVTPSQFEQLQKSNLPFTVLIPDVQAKIDAEAAEIAGPQPRGTWDAYMDNATVNAYMASLAALRPDLAQVINVGTTLEGRTIQGLRITGPGLSVKPGVLYHGCEHAREWITVPVTLYVADQLVRNYDTDLGIQELVDRCEWFIIPVFNVDGYLYTWSTNRLWRKNRRNNGGSFGVDINRNWGYQWGGEGAATVGSDETYRGTAPFSEPETQAMRDFFLAHPNIVTHNDIHSYSQLILWPWGYQAATSPDEPIFNFVGTTMQSLISSVHGTAFDPGPIYTNIYPASGVSVDWTYGVQRVHAFSFELRDTGTNGFTLPANQILPSCEEMFPALMFQADHISSIRPAMKIEFPNGLPILQTPNVTSNFNVRITGDWDVVNPATATLHARTGSSGAFTAYPLAYVSGNDFVATFPARGCGDPTEYYISSQSSGGTEIRSPAAAPAAKYTVPVGEETPYFSDNFETNQSWTVLNNAVTGGAWVRADPVGTNISGAPVQPEDDNPAGTGTMCWVTGNGAVGGSAGGADLDGGPTRLTSPTIDMSGLASPLLSYYRWMYCSTGEDTLVVEISNNNGANWVTIETVTHDPVWRKNSILVSSYVTPTNQMKIRFSATDNPNNSITDAAIDDVVVSSVSCAVVPVSGDLNCDNAVNTLDIDPMVLALTNPDAYIDAFQTCNIMRGDMNNDAAVNGDDIPAFVAAVSGP